MRKTKKPTMYRIVYVENGQMYRGQWWTIRHSDYVAKHIAAAMEAGDLYDIEVM